MFEKEDTVKPGFNKEACHSYFQKTLTCNKKKRKSEFPAWIKKLNELLNVFDLKSSTYKEITGIINKLKSSGSLCPHDEMSIIILKRCPILSSLVIKEICACAPIAHANL